MPCHFLMIFSKGLSIKDVHSQGVVQCGHFADKWVLQMWTSALFGAKNFGCLENLWCVRTDKGRRGQFFRDFVRKSFTDGLEQMQPPRMNWSVFKHLRLNNPTQGRLDIVIRTDKLQQIVDMSVSFNNRELVSGCAIFLRVFVLTTHCHTKSLLFANRKKPGIKNEHYVKSLPRFV